MLRTDVIRVETEMERNTLNFICSFVREGTAGIVIQHCDDRMCDVQALLKKGQLKVVHRYENAISLLPTPEGWTISRGAYSIPRIPRFEGELEEGLVAILGLDERVGTSPNIRKQKNNARLKQNDPAPSAILRRTPWVARLRLDQTKLVRAFVSYKKDYTGASRRGDHVKRWYTLPEGVYEVHEILSMQRSRRYFVRSVAGQFIELPREEVVQWLAPSASVA